MVDVPMARDELHATLYNLMEHIPTILRQLTEDYEAVQHYAPPNWATTNDFSTRCDELADVARVVFRLAYYVECDRWPDVEPNPPRHLRHLIGEGGD
jgi:hypothetical protein